MLEKENNVEEKNSKREKGIEFYYYYYFKIHVSTQ